MVDWKKEYKTSDLFKRDKAPAGDEPGADPAELEAADEPATSLLKKEIHLFGGKKKAPKAPKEPKPAKAPRAVTVSWQRE